MNDPFDVLVSRYLDGTADSDDLRRLDERLQADGEARHNLFIAAAQDAQLREILAVESISQGPSLTFPSRRPARLIAAAAAVLIVAGGLGLFLNRYPQPEITGPCRIVGGGEVQRGSVIATDDGPGAIALGGYCHVVMGSQSTVRLEGEKREEQVFLQRGDVVCEADRGVGRFTVRTDVGSVSVKGTKFTVQVLEKRGEEVMFDKRMVVGVLMGTVLVTGTWGNATLRAGQEASLPPPGAALGSIIAGFELPPDQQSKLDRMLSVSRTIELRASYRTEVRGRLFDAARRKLQASMPKLMPTKVSPKIKALRSKKRAGPPAAGDIARIRFASQKRARAVMMPLLHTTADALSDEAARDDLLIGWLLAKQVRAKLPGEKITAFDKAVKDAGISDREPRYLARAEAVLDAAMTTYDPDITGIVDPETGKVIVSDEELGSPIKDEALARRIAEVVRGTLTGLDLDDNTMSTIAPMLTSPEIEGARLNYCMAVRARLFDAARKTQATAAPRKMSTVVQAKVMAIRTRVKAGGPPNATDIARIQRAVMKRTHGVMAENLHKTADAVAVNAAKDEKLVAAYVARTVRKRLPPAKAAAFDTALTTAGITGDESTYIAEARQRIETAIETHDPDLTGIVSPVTGKVIIKD